MQLGGLRFRPSRKRNPPNCIGIHGIRRITLSTKSEKSHVIVSVSDTGHGIPKKIRSKIFEPFFTTKKVGKGTGLGLSISYGIIKECGGKITATNNPDGGAFFQIRFPIPGND